MKNRFGRAFLRGIGVAMVVACAVGFTPSALAQVQTEGAALNGSGGVVPLSAGGLNSCGIRDDGTLACWGASPLGQSTPPAGTFIALAAGVRHACAIRSNGRPECWGDPNTPQVTVPEWGQFTAITVGDHHTCGLRAWGAAECWGEDQHGETMVPAGHFIALSAGTDFSCGLRPDGSAECWGNADQGSTAAPSGQFISLSSAGARTCALAVDGQATCWGGYAEGAPMPEGRFVQISLGNDYEGCGLRADRSVACWGGGPLTRLPPPSGPNPNDAFLTVSAGTMHACGLRTNGELVCWGENQEGQASAPAGRFGFGQLGAGVSHTCQVRPDGQTACWGNSADAMLPGMPGPGAAIDAGDGFTCVEGLDNRLTCVGRNDNGQTNAPAEPMRHWSLGHQHGCGVDAVTGGVQCWGWGNFGQTAAPTGLFRNVSAGFVHSCGTRGDGTGACWGHDAQQQRQVPTLEAGQGYVAVQAGDFEGCGLASNGFISCWGDGYFGQLAYPPTGYFRAMAAGGSHGCAIRTDGRLACWGADWSGQRLAPEGEFVSVSAGVNHTCAIRADGTRACWGDNGNGQSPQPTVVPEHDTLVTALAEPFTLRLALAGSYQGPDGLAVALTGGMLPPGITLGADGAFQGAATQAGSYAFSVHVRDVNGFAASKDYLFVVDVTPPTVAPVLNGPLGQGGWYVGDVALSWSVHDAESSFWATEGCDSPVVRADTVGTEFGCAVQSVGGNASARVTIKRDATAPETNLTAAPASATHQANASFSFEGADATSGIAGYECRIDGAAFAACAPDHTVTVAAGDHTFEVRAVDVAGNRDPSPALHAWRVDTSPPVVTADVQGPLSASGWYTGDVRISWTVTDAETAVSSALGCNTVTQYSDTLGAGFTCTATSGGGTTVRTVTIKRDSVAPTVALQTSPAPSGGAWYNAPVTVSFVCQDATSGVASCPAAQVLSAEGTTASIAKPAVDAAGNSTMSGVASVSIDRTPPVLSPRVGNGVVLLNASATASVGASDALSGVASEGCAVPSSTSVGTQSVQCSARDVAGNEATANANYRVVYPWQGFSGVVANPNTLNVFKAGRAVPFQWRLLDGNGQPVGNLGSASITSVAIACPGGATLNRIATYGGSSTQLRNLGNGNYAMDWPAASSYRGTCRRVELRLGDGEMHAALFQFN